MDVTCGSWSWRMGDHQSLIGNQPLDQNLDVRQNRSSPEPSEMTEASVPVLNVRPPLSIQGDATDESLGVLSALWCRSMAIYFQALRRRSMRRNSRKDCSVLLRVRYLLLMGGLVLKLFFFLRATARKLYFSRPQSPGRTTTPQSLPGIDHGMTTFSL